MDKKKSLIAKILIPILIAVAIIAIFIAKNMQNTTTEPSVIDSSKQTDNHKGFPLKITSVSLEEIKQYGIPTVSAKYSCGFPDPQVLPIIVVDRYLDYFTTIMEDRLWQVLAEPVSRWRNRSGLSMNAARAA